MPRTPPSQDGPDLLDMLEEQEKGPLPCPHVYGVGKNGYGWTHQTDPRRPYFGEWVHADPHCMRSARPGHSVQILPRVGWSRKLQKDVPL